VCTDICVISTVHHARNVDYRCVVLTDAVAGTTRERHAAALACMEHVFARLATAAEAARVVGISVPAAARA